MSEDGHLQALADENARLRQEVATVTEQMANAEARASSFEDDLAKALKQRDAAVAEAAVLRHRDRRTQAARIVVEEAETLVAVWLDGERAGVGSALTTAVQSYWKAQETGLSATESADQARVVPESTRGPETQGEAQGADEAPEDEREAWAALREAGKWGQGERKPRVWNEGDPEPEGVEQVRDRDGDLVTRTAYGYWWWMDPGHEPPLPAAKWEYLLQRYAPLTEVLPEPAPAADNDHDPDGAEQARLRAEIRAMADNWTAKDGRTNSSDEYLRLSAEVGRLIRGQAHALLNGGSEATGRLIVAQLAHVHGLAPAKPDGEVPEAGRAGEAQTITDEAISDGYLAWLNAAGSNVRDRFAAGLRAASPLIERAALLAAADDWMVDWLAEGTGFPENTDAWLKRRATRTETS